MLSAILQKECDFVAIEIDILYIDAQELQALHVLLKLQALFFSMLVYF